jgi:hypothetical protein
LLTAGKTLFLKMEKFLFKKPRLNVIDGDGVTTKEDSRCVSTLTVPATATTHRINSPYDHLPKQQCGKRSLSFQPHWCETFKWLMVTPDVPGVLCGICKKAHDLQLLIDTVADRRLEDAFISSGMNNWKRALEKFKSHEKTNCHNFAVIQLQQYSKSAAVNAQLSQQITDDQAIAQKALRAIITSVLYLARQGLPLRGHENNDGNFSQLLLLRCFDDPALKRWFEGRYKQFTSWTVQNELLQLSAHRILRELCAVIRHAKQFSVIVDGTTDMSCNEQESVVIRYTDDNLCPHQMLDVVFVLL